MVNIEASKRIKVRVKYTQLSMDDVLPLNFETELVTWVTSDDEVIPAKYATIETKEGRVTKLISDEFTIPKGNYKKTNFIGANGETYGDDWIYKCTGKSIADIFEKY